MSPSLTGVLADPGRLAALRQTNLLDTPAEEVFDRLARLAARVLGTPVAMISLIDRDRQFFKACFGVPEPWASARQTPVSHSICPHLLATRRPLVIRDARWDPLGSDNPFMAELGAVAYLGVPLILPPGHVLGSFCVADRRPRDWTGDDVANLTDLAGLVMDEEELKRGRDVAEQLAAALERERAEADHLRAVDKMKTTFLEAVSHDLRTPLTNVLGIALTLERGSESLRAEDVADLIRRLTTNARKLDRLLSDLLDLDRLARGTLTPRRQVVDIGALTRRSVEEAAVRDEHPVVVDAAALQIAVDGPKVERIVENLVVNAARYTEAGTTIWVRIRAEGDGALLVVEDEGPGVPMQFRERIFQPFDQGREVAACASGSGIGLTLVAQFANLHGGRAWVEDRPGGGASFRVYLPGRPASKASPAVRG